MVRSVVPVLPVLVFVLALSASILYTRVGAPERAYAATASTLNFQARLLNGDGSIVADGNYNVEFKLYDASTGGAAIWTETRTGANRVAVKSGYLSVYLGDVTTLPSSGWDQERFLTLNIGGAGVTPSWDGEMNPRLRLTAVPYAFQAQRAEGLEKLVGSFTGYFQFPATLGQNTTYTLPDPGQASVNICLSSGNCAGQGGAIAGSGTQGRIAYFDTVSGSNIADGWLFQDSGNSTLELDSSRNLSLLGGNLSVTGNGSFTGNLTIGDSAGDTLTINGTAVSIPNGLNVDSNTFVIDATNNRVGIGDTTPAAALTVGNGDLFQVNSGGAIAAATGITSSGTITFSGLGTGIVTANGSGTLTSGTVDRNSSTYFTGTMSVSNGGTGATTFTSNGILYGNGTGAVQSTGSAADSVLITSGTNVPSLSQTLPTSVQGNITTVGALTGGSIANGFGTISTANNITTTAALQGGTLSVSGNGTVGGTFEVQGASLTVGTTTQNGSLVLNDGATNTATILSAVLGQNTAFTLPDTNSANAEFCVRYGSGSSNCSGLGNAVDSLNNLQGALTLQGTANEIEVTDNGTDTITIGLPDDVTIGNNLTVTTNASIGGTLGVTGTSTFTGLATFNGGLTVSNNSNFSQTGTGTFSTGSGSVSLNGNTSVTGTNTFTVGTGLTTLGGGLTATGTTNINTTGTATTAIGNASATLTLNGSSIVLGTASVTRTAAGTTTFDLIDGANTTLAVTNTGTGVANLTVDGSGTFATGLTVSSGGATITGNSTITGTLTGLTGLTSSGTITFSGLSAGLVTADGSGVLGSGTVDRDSSSYFSGTLSVANGGTGATTFTSNGILFGNGTGAIQATGTANNAVLVTDASGNPSLAQTLPTAVQGNITSTGALDAGSITANFGSIDVGADAISTTGTVSAGTLTVSGNATVGGTLGVTGLATFSGGLTVTNGNQLTNAGSTLFTAINISDKPAGGSIGTAAATVDAATTFNVNQTTTGQTLTLPTPTDTTAGRIIYVNNIGTANFSMGGVLISSGRAQGFIWTGTAWTGAGIDSAGDGANQVGAVDGQPKNANGAVITNNTLYLQTADATYPGLVSTGSQTFAGAKTFNGQITAGAGINLGSQTLQGTTAIINFTNFDVDASGNTSIAGTLSVTGTVTLDNLGAGIVTADANGLLSSGTVDRDSSSYFSGTLSVANGGTGATTFTSNGILFGNGTGAIQATGTANNAVLVTDASGNPSLAQTLPTAVQGNITSTGALTSGSIANGFGTISTANNITTTAALSGGSLTVTNDATVGGDVTVSGGQITVGTAAGQAGSLILYDGGSGGTQHTLTVDVEATLGQNTVITFPDPGVAAAEVCYRNDSNCGFALATGANYVQFTPNAAQVDNNAFASIYINDTGGGNLLHLQSGGTDMFVVGNNGNVTTAGDLAVNGGDITSATSLNVTANNGALTFTSVGATSDIILNSGRNIELQDNTNITGNLDVSGTLAVGTANGFTVNASGAITAATGIVSSGTIQFSGLSTGIVTSNGTGVIASGTLDRNSSSYFTGTLSVANGGTGASTFNTNGVIYYDGSTQVSTTAGANSVLITNGTNVPSLSQTLPNAVQDNITRTGALDSGSITSGFGSIDVGADSISTTGTVSGGIVDATTGFRINGGAAAGNYLRGDGTNFVSSALMASDLSGTIFSSSADTGTGTFVTGDTIAIQGGTNGIDTSLTGDTYTINLDTTEIGTTTFGSGSGFTWTFNTGGTTPSIAFASDAITVSAANTTLSGDLAVNGGDLTSTSSLNVSAGNGALTLTSTGLGNDIVLNSADTIELQDDTNITGDLSVTGSGTFQTGIATQDQIVISVAGVGANRFTGTITNNDLTAARTYNLPDATGTFITTGNLLDITAVGTITAGTWNGSSIADAYIDDAITISSGGSVDWTALMNYPTGCGAGQAVTAVGDTLTCATFAASDTDTTYTAGNDLDLSGTTFNIESQLDFVSVINQTGANLTLQTTTSGNIVLNSAGTIELQDNTNVTGSLSVSNGLTVSAGGASITGNTTIATSAGNTLSLGNATGTLTVTGSSASTFVINGVTITASEFNLLDGKDAALVDVNDAVNTAITGTGALTSGSIGSGFGTISTGNNITTTATIQGGIVNATTGFRINGGATAGNYLRGDGTNFVSSALQASDISGTIFSSAADTGTGTFVTGDTISIQGGTNGIDTTLSGDTFTVNLDTTEIGTTTFGSGAGFTWTFNVVGTDPTISFGNDTIGLGSSTTGLIVTHSTGALSDIDGNVLISDTVNITGGITATGNADFDGTLTVGTSGGFVVNASGAITAVTGITTTGGYTQSGTGANTFTGATGFTSTVSVATTSGTAFQVQNSGGADTLFTVDSSARGVGGGNLIKVGNSTGTDADVTILQVDSTTADITSNLSALNGGLYYNSTDNTLKAIINGTVDELCFSSLGNCAGSGAGVTQSGTNANGQIAYFTSGNNITSSANFLFDGTNVDVGGALTVGTADALTIEADGDIVTTGDLAVNGGDITSTGALNITPGGAMTLGATGQTALLQGSSVSITSNGVGSDITLTSADQIILNAVGTIELQDNTNVTGDITVSGNATLGDANTDTLTINGTAVSIPNNLNFDNNTLYIDAANNRIGIGMITPAYTLDVAGDARISAQLGIGSTPLSNVRLNIGGTQSSTDNAFGTYTGTLTLAPADANAAYFMHSGGGAVDTGVANTISRAAGIYVEAISKTGTGTITNTYGLYVNPSTSGVNNYGAYIGGNVGIGDATPVATLTVGDGDLFQVAGATGNITTSGDLAVNGGDITSTGALNITPGGALTVGATGQNATVQGAITTITSNGAGNDIILSSADTIELQGATNITGSLTVSVNADIAGTLFVGTGDAFQVDASGNITTSGDLAVNGGDITSTGALNITPGGALTVGAIGQTALLQGSAVSITSNGVGSDITLTSADQIILNAAGTIELQDNTNITGDLSVTGNTILGDASSDTLTINGTSVAIPNNLNIDNNTLFIDATNNRIGMGTNSPQFQLHVVNDGSAVFMTGESYSASGGTIFQGRAAGGTQGSPTALSDGNLITQLGARGYDGTAFTGTKAAITMNSVGTWSGTNTGTSMSFYTTPENSTTLTRQLFIQSDGSVAFGQNAPSAPFAGKVVDIQNSTGNAILNINASGGDAAMIVLGDGTSRWHIENDANDFFSLTQTGVAQRFVIDTSGNLGLGIYNATARLHVVGATGGTEDAFIVDNADGTGDIIDARDNGTTVFRVEDGGNVTASGNLAVNGGSITSTSAAFVINAGGAIDLQDGVTADSLTLDTGGLTVSGVATDITTGTNEDLTVIADGTGIINLDDIVRIGTLAAADTDSYTLCRDASSGQLTACDANTTGKPFLQGGNSFGATAVLGTNDNNALSLITNGTTRLTVEADGDIAFDTDTLFVDAANNRVAIGTTSTTYNAVSSALTVVPTGGDSVNGITIKAPNSSWGVGQAYGTGQVIEYLKYGTAGTEPDDLVLFRVDQTGGIGTAGAMHIGTGLRQDVGYTTPQALWVDLYIDTIGQIITASDSQTQPLFVLQSSAGTTMSRFTDTGLFQGATGSAATPSISFFGDQDTGIYSGGANQLSFATGGQQRLYVSSNGELRFAEGGTRTLTVETRTTNAAGNTLAIKGGFAGAGATGMAGGNVVIQGGNAAGTSGAANGGDAYVFGGAGVNGGNTGNVVLAHNGFTAGGNVGIGDNTPAATLTVGSGDLFQVAGATGNVTTAGDLAVNGGDITSTGALNVTPGGAMTLGATSQTALIQASTVTVTSNGAGNDITLTSADQILIDAGSSIELQDNTNIAGNLDVTGTLAVGTANQFLVSSGGALTFSGVATDITTGTNEDLTVVADGTGVIDLNDTVRIGTLAASDTDSYAVCRDASSGQLSACDANTTGKPFLQGGNTFGAIAVLGTNDAQDLSFETNNIVRLTVKGSTGNVGIGTTGPGTTRLVVKGATSDNTAGAFNATNSSDASLLYVQNDGKIGIGTAAPTADLTFGAGANRTISVISQTTANAAGNSLTLQAATGNGTGTGGALQLTAGTGGGSAGAGGELLLQGGAAGAGSTTSGSVIVRSNGNNKTSAFVVQNAASSPVFTVDTVNTRITVGAGAGSVLANRNLDVAVAEITNQLHVGGATNYIQTNASTGQLRFAGTARNSKTVSLMPEFAGAVLTGDGSNNTGTMTSDFCINRSTSPALQINVSGSNCGTDESRNYYQWTAQATNDYDVWVRWQVPSDFDGWAASNPIQFYGWRSSSSAGTSVTMTLYNESGAVCGTATPITNTNTWAVTNYSSSGCTTAAGSTLLIRITLSVGVNNEIARIGEIKLNYLSNF